MEQRGAAGVAVPFEIQVEITRTRGCIEEGAVADQAARWIREVSSRRRIHRAQSCSLKRHARFTACYILASARTEPSATVADLPEQLAGVANTQGCGVAAG